MYKRQLEIIVSVNGKNVPNYVQSEGNAKFRINFKPLEAQTHMLSVKFNNEFVPNSPFACEIQGSKSVSLTGPGIQLCSVRKPTSFSIENGNGSRSSNNNASSSSSSNSSNDDPDQEHNNSSSNNNMYEVAIVSPSGQELPYKMSSNKSNSSCVIDYTPHEVGPHIVKLTQDNVPVEGSPFTCNVYDVGKILLGGLPKYCKVGSAVTFTVDASKAGEGNDTNTNT